MNQQQDSVLRFREVREIVGLSRSTIWRMVRARTFPAPIQLASASSVGWLRSEVLTWMRERAAQRRSKQPAT